MYTNSVKHIRIQNVVKTCIIRKFVVHLQSLINNTMEYETTATIFLIIQQKQK